MGERIELFVCHLNHLWQVPGKTKVQQRMLKFRTKTPVNKELSYIFLMKSHWKRRKCAKISAFG